MDGTLIILVLLVLMYVVLFLPRQRQAARQRAMQAALATGDEVVTIGGIHGTVIELAEDSVVLEVSPGVPVRFVREAVARRVGQNPSPGDASEQGGRSDSSSTGDLGEGSAPS